MGDGTKDNPYTRKDVLRLIKENGGTAKSLDLSGKVFEEEINLSDLPLKGIILNKSVLFLAKFDGSNLSEAKLREAKLIRATFNQCKNEPAAKFVNLRDADLSNADLSGAEFIGAFLDNAKFNNSMLEEANFTIKGRREPDLLFTDFRGADLTFSDFTGRTFSFTKLEGASINWAKITEALLGDADWGNYIIGEEKKNNFFAARHRYRQLKLWYNNNGYHDKAAKFYYREKEANRKSLKWYSRHRLALESLRALFGYGEDWKRVLYWMALVILGSTAAYYLSGELSLPYSLYFSIISFTALGYGKWVDIIPQGWVQALGAFQSFSGVFLMALLLVTFFRKWTR
jgi:hypothetical protein